MGYGIADRRRGWAGSDLTDAKWHFIFCVDELDFDFRHIAEFQNGIGFPVCLLYTSPSPRDS